MIVKTKMEDNPTAVETTARELLPLPTSNADALRSTKSEEKHPSEWPPLVVPFHSLSQPTSTSDDVVLYAMKHSEDLLFPEKVRTAVLSDSFFGIRQLSTMLFLTCSLFNSADVTSSLRCEEAH
jgi:hypothetical protein